ncbi:MAG: hypothetical protein RL199_1131 [Pseudomonadota bacterium]|jgi:hypothetical protein
MRVRLVLAAMTLASVALAADAPRRKVVIKLDEIAVEGRIQKPQAIYVLPRGSLNFQGTQQRESLLPKVSRRLAERSLPDDRP